MSREPSSSDPVALGRIALKQVRVRRGEGERDGVPDKAALNRLVPYLDLFGRLEDPELARLGDVTPDVVARMRRQVVEICTGFERYVDLLPRLCDEELCRLTGANAKTIRFWRLCQPRDGGSNIRRAAAVRARADEQELAGVPTTLIDQTGSIETASVEAIEEQAQASLDDPAYLELGEIGEGDVEGERAT